MRVLLICAFILGGAATLQPADALAWQADGVPVCTNPGHQSNPLMVTDGAGGVFLAWVDYRNGFADVYAQHVTGSGAIASGWPNDGLAVCTAPDHQFISDLVTDDAGGLFLVWDDDRNIHPNAFDVYAHHVLANGLLDANWPVNGLAIATGPGDQRSSHLAPDGQGGLFVAWNDQQAAFLDMYMHHVSGSGTLAPGWPAGGKRVCTAPGQRGAADLIADGTGGAFVVFADLRTSSTTSVDVYALRVTADGSPAAGWTADGTAISTTTGVQSLPGLVSDGSGGFYVDWVDWRTAPPPPSDPSDPSYGHVYLQHMTGAGSLVPGWPVNGLGVCTATGGQQEVKLDADGVGGALVAWFDQRSPNPGIYLERLLTTGALSPGWPANGLRVSTAGGDFPGLVADGTGGAYVSLATFGGTFYQVRGQHITGDGTLAFGWPPAGVRLAFTVGQQDDPSIAADGLGGAIVAWDDTRNGFNADIYAQQLVPNGPTATLVSLMSADAQSDRVRLTWLASDPSQLIATVERRTETTDWAPLGTIYPDGSGQLIYEDRDVVPGSRYGYRLSYADGGVVTTTSETWVNVPGLVFALAGFTPNPTFGEPVVTFSLPVAGPATLELYDVQGRTVLRREVGSLGVGRHRMKLDARGALPAGVYAIRLRQGERQALVRAVVMR